MSKKLLLKSSECPEIAAIRKQQVERNRRDKERHDWLCDQRDRLKKEVMEAARQEWMAIINVLKRMNKLPPDFDVNPDTSPWNLEWQGEIGGEEALFLAARKKESIGDILRGLLDLDS